MKTASELKIQKVGDYKYIVIYFKYRGNMIRINTRYRYLGKEYHSKGLAYNNKVPRYLHANSAMATMKYRVDTYIGEQMRQFFPRINQKRTCKSLKNGVY